MEEPDFSEIDLVRVAEARRRIAAIRDYMAYGTEWPGVDGPVIADADVIQLGERESRDADFALPDLKDTAIHTIDAFEAIAIEVAGVAARISTMLAAKPDHGFRVHLDVDILDQAIMPAAIALAVPVYRQRIW
ncbi:MAG: hypothetical protein EOO77_20605 [Oxalobacteraceae bacterium]|nr:MAG: hypothetical protein EOO77_20605 [Oxalobacteraceae bacterium]